MSPLRAGLLTALALAAFASNSILCRLALREEQIDAASFTTIRLVSGAIALWLLFSLRSKQKGAGNAISGFMLALYAIAFSFAYVSLESGVGALILFGMVQATMISYGIVRGERPGLQEWLGLLIALCGLVYLVSPGLSAPDPLGAAFMAIAGIAWGAYTLRGRGAEHPALATAENFRWSAPFAIALSAVLFSQIEFTNVGVVYAVVSGVVTSGLGYILWYAVQPSLTSTRAAIVQLSVPILTAFAGALLLSEQITMRLIVASIATLGGIALAVCFSNRQQAVPKTDPDEPKTQ